MVNGRNNSRVEVGPLVLVAAMLHLHLDLAVGRIGAEPKRLGLRDVRDGKGVANEEVAYVGEVKQVLNLHWKGRDVLLGVDNDLSEARARDSRLVL